MGNLRERSVSGQMGLGDIAALMRFGGLRRNESGNFAFGDFMRARGRLESGEGFTAENIRRFITEDIGGMGGQRPESQAFVAQSVLRDLGVNVGTDMIMDIMEGRQSGTLDRRLRCAAGRARRFREGGGLAGLVRGTTDEAQRASAQRGLRENQIAETLTAGFVKLQEAQGYLSAVMGDFNGALSSAATALGDFA